MTKEFRVWVLEGTPGLRITLTIQHACDDPKCHLRKLLEERP